MVVRGVPVNTPHRLANPGPEPVEATVRLAFAVAGAESARLDETPDDGDVALAAGADGGAEIRLVVGPHGLRTVRLRPT